MVVSVTSGNPEHNMAFRAQGPQLERELCLDVEGTAGQRRAFFSTELLGLLDCSIPKLKRVL